ncbi:hypothetical protein LTR95_009131 [Oleoguttula sp. CCFEE 5521]
MTSIIDQQFADWFNRAVKLYDNDKLEECITEAREILNDSACPRYHRMKTLVLLGNCAGDFEEANDCCNQAKALWRIVRRWNPAGVDESADQAMDELRGLIDDLRAVLKEEAPNAYNADEAVDSIVATHDARVAEEMVQHEADFGDEIRYERELAEEYGEET